MARGIHHLMAGPLSLNGWGTYGLNGWGSYDKSKLLFRLEICSKNVGLLLKHDRP